MQHSVMSGRPNIDPDRTRRWRCLKCGTVARYATPAERDAGSKAHKAEGCTPQPQKRTQERRQ